MILALVVVVIIIVVAIFYGRSVSKKDKSRANAWKDSFMSVSLSALLAFSLALALYYLQNNDEENTKRKAHLVLLENEIGYVVNSIDNRLNTVIFAEGDTIKTRLVYLPSLALEEAAKSGLFPPSRSWSMLSLAALIREYNMITNYLIASMSVGSANPMIENQVSHAVERLIWSESTIKNGASAIINQMQLGEPTMAELSFPTTPGSRR